MKRGVFVVLIALVCSCKSDILAPYNFGADADFSGDRNKLIQGEWKLDAYETGVVSESTVLQFVNQKNSKGLFIISGTSSINFFEGGYEFTGTSSLKVRELSVTEMGGSKEKVEFEKTFLERLMAIESFSFKDNTLILSNSKGSQMYFKK